MRPHREQLAPSGVSLAQLRAEPAGLRRPLTTTYLKYRTLDDRGNGRGFPTPTRKVEFWSEMFADHGYSALPDIVEPSVSANPRLAPAGQLPSRPDLREAGLVCQSQHRSLPSLRSAPSTRKSSYTRQPQRPEGVRDGDWVEVRTLNRAMRAKARFNEHAGSTCRR